MTYDETVEYLFSAAPLFQHIGKGAYKEGLETTRTLDHHFDHPHQKYRTVHVAGTNGKGSTAHTLAAILQHAGYKVGLFTSPHLLDFRERIRINGEKISQEYVVRFVEEERPFFEPLHPSFFELTTAMAFKYFADNKVDVAVIEVGLGGRLDCTNIITPELSVITNISLDHTQFLGNTLGQIAREKAGIIKPGVPVVIGETVPETYTVFQQQAHSLQAPITFAGESDEILSAVPTADGRLHYQTRNWGSFDAELTGEYQIRNANTILHAAAILSQNFRLTTADVHYAFAHVCNMTGLQGRWQTVHDNPKVICDAGHNSGGWQYLGHQLNEESRKYDRIRIVFGVAGDKDISAILHLLPHQAQYYWTKASVKRALNENELKALADRNHLDGQAFATVAEAYEKALAESSSNDLIYIGGSCFVVADFLSHIQS